MLINEFKEKRFNTLVKNNSFNKSIPEEKSYILLKEKYPDVLRQYKSTVYPYHCDFYIPSLDLYIECNYHWTHGGHPYDPLNSEDIKKYNKWKTIYNFKYCETWTIRDVKKRNTAKQNNLNWLEFFSIQELKDWLGKQ